MLSFKFQSPSFKIEDFGRKECACERVRACYIISCISAFSLFWEYEKNILMWAHVSWLSNIFPFQGHESVDIQSIIFIMNNGPSFGHIGARGGSPWVAQIPSSCLAFLSGTDTNSGNLQSITLHWKQACEEG